MKNQPALGTPATRREFLKTSGTTVLGGVLAAWSCVGPTATWAATAPAKRKRELKRAIHLDMINVDGRFLDKLQLAQELGFDGLEINSPSNLDKNELLKACEATGLRVASVMDSVHWKDPLSDPDPAVRARGVEGLKVALTDAKTFGCHSVLLVPAVVNKEVSYFISRNSAAKNETRRDYGKVSRWNCGKGTAIGRR